VKKKYWIQALGLIFMVSSMMSVTAQMDNEKMYLIEVIVFENTGPDSADNELFGRGFEMDLDEPTPTSDPQIEEPALSFVQTGTLEKIIADLHDSARYNLLKQLAWIQSAISKNDAPVVSIGDQSTLSGQVRFYARTLLFIELELRFNQPLKNIPNTTVPYSSRFYQTPVYTIKETRRLKLNEIHYFDHPRFGALVKVSRWTQQP
jgi:hypothetical protein